MKELRDIKSFKKLIELFGLAMAIQRETDFGVFFDYSGHVDSLSIKITRTKEDYQTNVLETEFYTEYKKLEQFNKAFDSDAFLQAKINVLKRILEEHDIPEDLVETHVRQVYENYF